MPPIQTMNAQVATKNGPTMATAAKPPADNPFIFPPEETIWRKYSAHYEFPLSIMASLCLHFFVFMMVVLLGALLFGLGSTEPPEVEAVEFAGGGGSGDGAQAAPETQDLAMADPDISFKLDDVAIDDSAKNEKLQADLSSDKTFDQLPNDPAKRVGDQGKGGSGAGGGLGEGFGTGEGSGAGPGKRSKRAMRTDRWGVQLYYNTGEDLYQEWAKLKAVILVPEGQLKTGTDYQSFRVYRDLSTKSPPFKSETRQQVNTLNRVWWASRDLVAIEKLSKFLNLPSRPPFIAFFIPRELEDELLKKELAYKGKKEDQLEGWFTTFEVKRIGDKFEAKVLKQENEKKKR